MLRRTLNSVLPTKVRVQGPLFFWNLILDVWDRVTGKADADIPPRHLNISGRGSFQTFGQHNLTLCREFGDLDADDVVLDVGCGIGRTAAAMAGFLSASGRYAGFDVADFAIDWCRTHIAPRHSHFEFVHADVCNRLYNPRGHIPPDRYRFPWPEEEFTFCVATSVFTHVLPSTAEHYIAEISRVLRPDGRFLSTWFLLDDAAEQAIAAGRIERQTQAVM